MKGVYRFLSGAGSSWRLGEQTEAEDFAHRPIARIRPIEQPVAKTQGKADMCTNAEANLTALIESTEDHIWSVDLDLRLNVFNRAFQHYMEPLYDIRLAAGMLMTDIFPPDRASLWLSLFQNVLANGPQKKEHVLRNGRTLDLVFNPIVAGGKVSGISIFGKDITERKLSEAQVRISADALHEAQAIGGLGTYVLDIETEIWTSSALMDEIFGIGKDYPRTLAGWTALIHPDDRAMINDYFASEVLGKGEPFRKEYRILRQTDQAERWVHGVGKLCFDAQAKPVKMNGVIKDITERKQAEMELRESEDRYRSTFEQAAVGIVHISFDGRILQCNHRFAEILGYTVEELCSMSFSQITPPAYLAVSDSVLKQLANGAPRISGWEKPYLRKDGSLTWAKLTSSVQRDSGGRPLHVLNFVEDINDCRDAQESLVCAREALRVSEERYRTAFQTSLDSVTINRISDGMFVDCNLGFLELMGYKRDEVLGRSSIELNIWADPRDRQNLAQILEQNPTCRDLEARFRKKSGEIIWGKMSASIIVLDGATCILAVTRDITGAKAAEDEIRNLAFYDSLTQLPNRRLLLDRLQQTLSANSQNRRMQALLFIDLDNFKSLNDTLGHELGDRYLQEIARRLVPCIGNTDTVARFGADEFVIMIEDLSEIAEDAAAYAKATGEKILEIVAQPILLAGRECVSTASIGITVFGHRQENANDVLQQADIAMHQAKTAGRNTIRIFAPALQAAVNARAAIQEQLRQAIKAEQFVLYYQPQVEHGRLIGTEALIRWNHPQRGLLAPADFIPMAEENGLIEPLGDWVLESACRQLAEWADKKESVNISIAINISARQFRETSFVQKVLEALDRTGAESRNLKLELTESMLASNIEEVISKMTYLKAHGLRFSLDDFGTGYSSLAYLKQLPLDQLKIDRSFVQDILVDASSGAIAQTIISLSRAMGLPVIAEGVETDEQREFLERLGCHSFQGFLFGRPLPLAEFHRLWLGQAECAGQVSI
jgi:diguanylate cyclase (GGDEF)-like protein/PAS domain S-box-containing protein